MKLKSLHIIISTHFKSSFQIIHSVSTLLGGPMTIACWQNAAKLLLQQNVCTSACPKLDSLHVSLLRQFASKHLERGLRLSVRGALQYFVRLVRKRYGWWRNAAAVRTPWRTVTGPGGTFTGPEILHNLIRSPALNISEARKWSYETCLSSWLDKNAIISIIGTS